MKKCVRCNKNKDQSGFYKRRDFVCRKCKQTGYYPQKPQKQIFLSNGHPYLDYAIEAKKLETRQPRWVCPFRLVEMHHPTRKLPRDNGLIIQLYETNSIKDIACLYGCTEGAIMARLKRLDGLLNYLKAIET